MLRGGAGNDKLDSTSYSRSRRIDKVLGGAGDDVVKGDSGGGFGEILVGGSGEDEIKGDDENDRLRGGSGDDDLRGRGGNDRLDGGPDNDFCDQGSGTGPVAACETFPPTRA